MDEMTFKHKQALNQMIAVGYLHNKLAAIIRRAGESADLDEQERQAVYERYLAAGKEAVLRAGKPWGAWAADFSGELLTALWLR